jgi:hypothetical protein
MGSSFHTRSFAFEMREGKERRGRDAPNSYLILKLIKIINQPEKMKYFLKEEIDGMTTHPISSEPKSHNKIPNSKQGIEEAFLKISPYTRTVNSGEISQLSRNSFWSRKNNNIFPDLFHSSRRHIHNLFHHTITNMESYFTNRRFVTNTPHFLLLV